MSRHRLLHLFITFFPALITFTETQGKTLITKLAMQNTFKPDQQKEWMRKLNFIQEEFSYFRDKLYYLANQTMDELIHGQIVGLKEEITCWLIQVEQGRRNLEKDTSGTFNKLPSPSDYDRMMRHLLDIMEIYQQVKVKYYSLADEVRHSMAA